MHLDLYTYVSVVSQLVNLLCIFSHKSLLVSSLSSDFASFYSDTHLVICLVLPEVMLKLLCIYDGKKQ